MIIDTIEAAVTSMQVSGEPYFSYGTWNDEANRLTNLNRILANQDKKFPLVFLLLDIEESFIETENSYESTLRLFVIGRTDLKYTPQKRHANELPALRTITTNLIKKLKIYNIRFSEYKKTEMFYPENKLNTPVNAIELEIPAIYQINCLT